VENLIRYKITEIPETRADQFGNTYHGYRQVNVIRGWQRFGHYIIDAIIIAGLRMLFNVITGYIGPDIGYDIPPDQLIQLELKLLAMGMIETMLYYGAFEVILGTTPGKMILGRLVIDEYGRRPETTSIMLRTICRLIPFEAISCLWPRGWHDQISKTFVVHQSEADALWNLLQKMERDTVQRDAENYRSQQ
jgi:uncharacterized RDD family membrane protein YckC